MFGTKHQKQEIGPIRWDLRLATLPIVLNMKITKKWDPISVTRIELPNCSLTIFHVGEFKNLQVLDLSNNRINNLRGTGLEQCDNLKILLLKNNFILKKENLKALWYK